MNKFAAYAISALALCLFPPAAQAEKVELVCQGLTMTHASSDVLRATFDQIHRDSDGEINISFVQVGAITKHEGAYPAIRDGMMDMGHYLPTHVSTQMPHALAMTLPWLTENAVHGGHVAEKLIASIPEINEEVNKDVKHLVAFAADRNAFLSHRPIRTPADLKGKRVMTWVPDLLDEIKGYGAIPVHVSMTDIYVGLQRGLGDVVYGSLPMFKTLKLTEIAKEFTVMPATSNSMQCIGGSLDTFDGLSRDHIAVIEKNFSGKGLAIATAIYEYGNRDLEQFQKDGIHIYYPTKEELTLFREASMPEMRAAIIKKLENADMKEPEKFMERVYAIARTVPSVN